MKTRSKPDANSIFECLEEIATKARGSEFSDEFLLKVKPYSDKLAAFLECQPREAVWFAIIFCINFRTHSVDLDDLSSYLECHPLKIVRCNDFDNLIKLRLIRKDSEENRRRRNRCGDRINALKFYVPKDVMVAISDGEKPNQTEKPNDLTVYEFLDGISDIIEEKDSEILSFRDMVSEFKLSMEFNGGLSLVKQAIQLKLSDEDLILLLFALSQFVNYETTIDLIRTIRVIFPSDIQFSIRRAFVQGKSNLQVKNLMQLAGADFKTDKTVELTEKAIDMFIPAEDKTLFLKRENKKMDVIYAKDIKEKHLYFNPDETKNLDFLLESLKPENYKSITDRMKEQGLNVGFSVLYHGDPGTGKTESVYQIARQTGRNIKMVVISETKSQWFGQSEKLIKSIFDEYRKMVEYCEVTPILLFNECDGLFGSRKTSGSSSVDNALTSMTNILLDELERFSGILFATTNLSKNIDSAFSRRFGFKAFFDKPSTEAKYHIWQDKIPTLIDGEAQKLADTFNLSGGEIDNICKKYHMNQVIYGKYPGIDELERYCRDETLVKNTEWKKIGFIR